MNAVLFRARADLRARWRSWIALGLLVGLIGGAVTAAAAGARRTDSAFGRFLADTRTPEVFTFTSNTDQGFARIDDATVGRLPEVIDSTRAVLPAVVDPPTRA